MNIENIVKNIVFFVLYELCKVCIGLLKMNNCYIFFILDCSFMFYYKKVLVGFLSK